MDSLLIENENNDEKLIKPVPVFKPDEESENSGVVILEPLEKGFGLTLGNALRRVMISSIRGAAVYAIKIEGVQHEFSSIQGVQEDVTDIIQNLKGLALQIDGNEQHKVTIKAKGPCIVTAGMISEHSVVQVKNPDAVICTLNAERTLTIELFINSGKGYIPASRARMLEAPLNLIMVDSLYSPVSRVAYRVENTRVGQDTDYDKLLMTIETNGVVSPEEAMHQAANILKGQLDIFASEADENDAPEETLEQALPFSPYLLRKVDELELSVRSSNCLKNDNIVYIGDLVQKSEHQMIRTPNFGRKSLNEIRDLLHSMGLELGMTVPDWPPENIEELAKKYSNNTF